MARRGVLRRAVPALHCVALVLVAGCKRASQSDPPSYRPLGPADLFADGASDRPLVAGVVPRPADRSPGIPYVTVLSAGPALSSDSAVSASIPFPITTAVLRRGQERFEINCVACHGRSGEGDGIVVQRGFTKPPSYYCRDLLTCPDATIYNAMANGYGAMYSFNDRLPPDDRWAVTAYIRALQQSATRAAPVDRPASYGGPAR
jgi:cytochrome c553